MEAPTFENKGDFLTLMLNDELFKDKDDYMIDECITFMTAATMTTTMLISNGVYHLTCNKSKLDKLRHEIKKCANINKDTTINWK